MKDYIVELTDRLIHKHRYDKLFAEIGDHNEFVRRVKIDLCYGDFQDMHPEILGRIMYSFAVGDVKAVREDLFNSVHFSGDCGEMFRELISLCLAYAIKERVDYCCPTDVPRWAMEKWPPLDYDTAVRTTQPNMNKRHQWTTEGWASKQWGVRGRIIRHHDSHGLFYVVEHEDGTEGVYDPHELEALSDDYMLPRQVSR